MTVNYYSAQSRPQSPLISICIANYNGQNLLADCIQSALRQINAPSFEILVHDDGSTDRSVELIQSHFPQVNLITSSNNVGFCVSNNRMVEWARGKYILLLNNDAALFPDALETLSATAEQFKNDILTLPQYDWTTGETVDRGCLIDWLYTPIPNTDINRSDVAYVIGACFWCPKSTWELAGGLPEWMESIGEDLYFCCIARLLGIRAHACKQSGYRHKQGASFGGNRTGKRGIQTTYRRRYLSEKNRLAAALICSPTPLFWALNLIQCGALVVEGLALSLISIDHGIFTKVYGKALFDHFLNLPNYLKIRRGAQAARICKAAEYYANISIKPRKLALLTKHGVPKINC